MIGLLFGELKRLSILRRVALIVGALAIPFIGNCGRAFFLSGLPRPKASLLLINGTISRAIRSWPPFLWDRWYWRQCWDGRRQGPEVRGQKSGVRSQGLPAFYVVVAFCWLGFIEIASEAWYRSHEQHLASLARWTVQWPEDAPGFREIKIDDAVRGTLRYDDGREAVWNTLFLTPKKIGAGEQATPTRCTLFAFRWKPGSTSVVRARAHRPDICLPSAGWHQISDRGVANYVVAGDFSVRFVTLRLLVAGPALWRTPFFVCRKINCIPLSRGLTCGLPART